jgi:spermidine/putrescine transport system substrate-binding protein
MDLDPVLGRRLDRRRFLRLAGFTTIGAAALVACKKAETAPPAAGGGDTGGGGSTGTTGEAVTRPAMTEEPGGLEVFDWGGYGDGAYYPKEERQFLWRAYETATGDAPTFVLFEDDDAGYAKVAAGARYDVVHPCAYRFKDWVDLGVLQPWDTAGLANFTSLNPALQAYGNLGGQQYFVVADWGFAAPMYRADVVEPSEDSWGLLWDDRYSGRISWWDSLNMLVVAAYYHGVADPWAMTDDELTQMRDFLIEKKPLVKFLWGQSFDLFRAFKQGEVDIGYAWPDAWTYAKGANIDVVYMQPKEGRTSWYCGFGLFADTENYFHAHEYVDSWTSTKAAEFLLNYYAYGHTNTAVDLSIIEPQIVEAFALDDPAVLEEPNTHAERPIERRDVYSEMWSEVKAA